eukprot:5891877-Heterocapsa_arctica.AAC.1
MLQHTACSQPPFPGPATISHAFLGASVFSSGVVRELALYYNVFHDELQCSTLFLELQCITDAGQGRAGMLQHT